MKSAYRGWVKKVTITWISSVEDQATRLKNGNELPRPFGKIKPLFSSSFLIPTNKQIDKKLIIGSILFGSGWGLIGLCPGPAITSLALANISSIIFVISMFTGFYIASKFN